MRVIDARGGTAWKAGGREENLLRKGLLQKQLKQKDAKMGCFRGLDFSVMGQEVPTFWEARGAMEPRGMMAELGTEGS